MSVAQLYVRPPPPPHPTPATLTPSCPPQDGLGLPRGASKAAVKRRYFELAKALHPDTDGGGAEPGGPAAAGGPAA